MKHTLHTLVATALLAASAAQAHQGHGQAAASHWHATDTLGLLLVAVLAAGALWLGRRK
jgi:type IV secretory pathway TrbF-like protein